MCRRIESVPVPPFELPARPNSFTRNPHGLTPSPVTRTSGDHPTTNRPGQPILQFIAAYCQPDRRRGETMMTAIIDSLRRGVPAGLAELVGRTLWRRHADVLASSTTTPPRPHRSDQRPSGSTAP